MYPQTFGDSNKWEYNLPLNTFSCIFCLEAAEGKTLYQNKKRPLIYLWQIYKKHKTCLTLGKMLFPFYVRKNWFTASTDEQIAFSSQLKFN